MCIFLLFSEYNSDDDFEGSTKGKCKLVDRNPIVVSSSEDELISGNGRNNDLITKVYYGSLM